VVPDSFSDYAVMVRLSSAGPTPAIPLRSYDGDESSKLARDKYGTFIPYWFAVSCRLIVAAALFSNEQVDD
jgi:hypothetical protein